MLQGIEIDGAAEIRTERLVDHRLGQQIGRNVELNGREFRKRFELNDQLNAEGAIHRIDPHIGKPTGGLDRIQIPLQVPSGDTAAGTNLHGVVGLELKPVQLRMSIEAFNPHLGDEHPGSHRIPLQWLRRLSKGRWRFQGDGDQRQAQSQPQKALTHGNRGAAIQASGHWGRAWPWLHGFRRHYRQFRGLGQADAIRLSTSPYASITPPKSLRKRSLSRIRCSASLV